MISYNSAVKFSPKAAQNQNLLKGLGKPTMRGVRKCPKCGSLNGSRGFQCKNKTCQMVFKTTLLNKAVRTSGGLLSVKLKTNSDEEHLFSVRVAEKGANLRGFVTLPVIIDEKGESIDPMTVSATELYSSAKCLVENCAWVPAGDATCCQHIVNAFNIKTTAIPYTIKESVLKIIEIPAFVAEEIQMLQQKYGFESLVQRTARDIYAVRGRSEKCAFVHSSVQETRGKSKDYIFSCSCSAFTRNMIENSSGVSDLKYCAHFYLCLLAFLSDRRLFKEYQSLIKAVTQDSRELPAGDDDDDDDDDAAVVDEQVLQFEEISVETIESQVPEITEGEIIHDVDVPASNDPCGTMKETSLDAAKYDTPDATDLRTEQRLEPCSVVTHAPLFRSKPAVITTPDEAVAVPFDEWLASVTERINETMHFQLSGSPDPLVFHVPESMFTLLQNRIATVGGKKRRLPNSTIGFVNRNVFPIGTFTRYSWKITNMLCLRQIFDTYKVALKVARTFLKAKDGSYRPFPEGKFFDTKDQGVEHVHEQYRTYLKVGMTGGAQSEPDAFVVEWIPDILPVTQTGEMRLMFKFGHKYPMRRMPEETVDESMDMVVDKEELVHSENRDGAIADLV